MRVPKLHCAPRKVSTTSMSQIFRRSVTTEAPKTRYVSAPASAALRRPTHFGLTTRLTPLDGDLDRLDRRRTVLRTVITSQLARPPPKREHRKPFILCELPARRRQRATRLDHQTRDRRSRPMRPIAPRFLPLNQVRARPDG